MQQREPILLGKQPGATKPIAAVKVSRSAALMRSPSLSRVMSALIRATSPRPWADASSGRAKAIPGKVQPHRITPAGPVQSGQRGDGQPRLLLAAARDLVTLHRGRLIGEQQGIVKSVVADLAVEALRRRHPHPVGDRVVEGAFTAVADDHSVAHSVVLSGQFDHEGVRQPPASPA